MPYHDDIRDVQNASHAHHGIAADLCLVFIEISSRKQNRETLAYDFAVSFFSLNGMEWKSLRLVL